jgi:RHS repeat-associated protein
LLNKKVTQQPEYAYDVYGTVIIRDTQDEIRNTSSAANPYFFTARRFDTETNLYYYRERYYSPKIGRFLQTDPISYEGGINLYAYCGNNPIIYVDPYGLCGDSTSWKVDSIIVTVLALGDALGLPIIDLSGVGIPSGGEFGRMDVYDMKYLYTIINPDPYAGIPGAIADEKSWDRAHFGTGAGLGYLGFDKTTARTLMEVFEMIEPGVWSGWGAWRDYQGRNIFEGGQRGINRDMEEGMKGYWYGKTLRD